MDDLVKRLRTGATTGTALTWTVTPIHTEAADRIAALEAKVAAADALADEADDAIFALRATGSGYQMGKAGKLSNRVAAYRGAGK